MYRSRHFLRWCFRGKLGGKLFPMIGPRDNNLQSILHSVISQCFLKPLAQRFISASRPFLFCKCQGSEHKKPKPQTKKNLPCFRQKVRKTFCTGRRNSFNSKTSSTRQSTSPHTIGSGWFQVITCLLTTRKGNSAVNWSSDKGVVIKAWTVRSLQVSHANSNLLWSLFRVESTIRFNDLRCGAGAVHTWIWESCLPLLPPPPFSCSW